MSRSARGRGIVAHRRTTAPTGWVPPTVPAGYRVRYQTHFPDSSVIASGWSIFNSPGNGGHGLRRSSQVTVGTDPVSGADCLIVTAQAGVDPQTGTGAQRILSGICTSQFYMRNAVVMARIRAERDVTRSMSPVALCYPPTTGAYVAYGWPRNGEIDWFEPGGGGSTIGQSVNGGTVTYLGQRFAGYNDHYSPTDVSGDDAKYSGALKFGTDTEFYRLYAVEKDGQVHNFFLDPQSSFGTTGPGFVQQRSDGRFHRRGVAQNVSFQLDATTDETDARFGGTFNSTSFPTNKMYVDWFAVWQPKAYDKTFTGIVATGGTAQALLNQFAWAQFNATTWPHPFNITDVGLTPTTTGYGLWVAPWDPPSDGNYESNATVRWVSGGGAVHTGPAARISTDGTTDGKYHVVARLHSDGTLRCYKVVNEVFTELSAAARYTPVGLTHGSTYTIKLRCYSDNTISVHWVQPDGTSPLVLGPYTVTDSGIPAVGSVGATLDAATGWVTGRGIARHFANDLPYHLVTQAQAVDQTTTVFEGGI
jgi:hypothetical protein